MENNNTNLQNQDPYSNKSNKIADFLIGYLGFFIVIAILYYLVFFVESSGAVTSFLAGRFWINIIMIPIIALVVANVGLKKNRRYIAKGINFAVITLILIPVLFFGACLISLNGYGR